MLQMLKGSGDTAQLLILVIGMLMISGGAPQVAAQTLEEAVAAYHRSDYPTALRGFRFYAEQGNDRAQFYLGYMHYHSQGIRSNWSEAEPWYRRAAEQGHPCAQLELGRMYEAGAGVRQDGSQAARWYRLAADGGVADAQAGLGRIYQDGRIVSRDSSESLRWYRASAEQEHQHAIIMLGHAFHYGKGVRQNYAEAVKWYRFGAELGYSSAQYFLGSMYGSGKGVRKDLVQAHKWYNLTASRTASDGIAAVMAAAHRDGVEKLLTPTELAEAERLAREWRSRTPTAHQQCKLGTLVRHRSDTTPETQNIADPTPERATTDEDRAGPRIADVQRALLRSGYDPGPIDGIIGIRTRLAIRSFEADHGLPVTGRVSEQLESAALRAIIAISPSGTAGARTAKEVFSSVFHSIVVVVAINADGVRTSQGSGVVVGQNEVVTNCHVISGANEIMVHRSMDPRVRTDRQMAAKSMARNEDRDLCLLFVDQLSEPSAAIPISLGKARDVSIGDEVYAIGAPRGLDLSLSRGVVSQLRGSHDERSAPLIQTDAAISPGSSGGGLFNGTGELIGITSFKLSGHGNEGISFAIPAEWVKALVASAQERIAARRARLVCFSSPTADCLFSMARELADAIDGAHKRAQVLRTIAQARAEAGDKAGARETFTAATQAAKRISSAGSLYGDGRAAALASIAQAQAEAGDKAGAESTFVKALETTRHIIRTRDRARVVRRIARAHTRAGVGVRVGAAIANAAVNAIHAVLLANENDRALALSFIVEAQAEVGDFHGARETVTLIHDASWRALNLRTIAKVLARAGDEAGARTAWSNAIEAIEHIDDDRQRAMNLAYTVEAQAEVGDINEARETARRIDDSYRSATAFAVKVIVEALTKAGNIAGIHDFVASINRASIPDIAWADIAQAQAEAGDIAGSLRTANQINYAEARDKASSWIARALAKMGDVTKALQIAEQIDDLDWRGWALNAIAVVQAKAGDEAGASETLATWVRTVNRIDDRFQRGSKLLDVAVAQAKGGDIVGALQTAGQIDDASVHARTLRHISVTQADAGDVTGALRTVKRIAELPVSTIRLTQVVDVELEKATPKTWRIEIDHNSTHAEALASIAVRIAKADVPKR